MLVTEMTLVSVTIAVVVELTNKSMGYPLREAEEGSRLVVVGGVGIAAAARPIIVRKATLPKIMLDWMNVTRVPLYLYSGLPLMSHPYTPLPVVNFIFCPRVPHNPKFSLEHQL